MEGHECKHESDFGTLFEMMKTMRIAIDSTKTSIDVFLKYMYSMEAIAENKKGRREWSMQKAIFYSSLVLGTSGIIVTLILEFSK